MSSLALGIVSDISMENFWVACSLSEDAPQFDAAILAACFLKETVEKYNESKT
jgi:hypothetical protein